ncbi:hypothetical protein ISF_08511 [Cordyceps fumosorosea ARSEF 2679]|uniref:Gastric mucin-like protein n=1 Tax=Cordyceps fumosorosea (strain ARSEF 2679) TaxID=1081104 RepID=A0A167M7E6_CORFA|nr:hypothetical protein ISF_08511 [Cordyceps fumosorosea ARSEF 2679]OAA54031.1 hypothetical protein ISF_08511 [Cordyceps fumosorosea ARSEF 2679]
MAEATSWESAIVAIEGPSKTVSTQLRLLPSTPHILILPTLDTYMPTTATASSFLDVYDPVHHLRQLNAAMKRRHRDAQAFLRGSSSNASENQESGSSTQRLVFLEGGAASAQALCLKALMHHETAGDRAAAEARLARLTRRGLAGLSQAGDEEEQRARSAPVSYSVAGHLEDDALLAVDPITRAMRAADALDRQTASLQVSNELDLTMRSLCRSSSLPLQDSTSGQDATAPSGQSSSFDDDDDQNTPTATAERPVKSPAPSQRHRFSVVHYDQQAEMPSVFGFDDFHTGRSAVSSLSTLTAVDSESKRESAGYPRHHRRFASSPISPVSDAFSLRSSFGQVEYGRASLLDMRSTTSVRRPSGGRGGSVQAAVGRGTTTHNHTTPKLNHNHHTADAPKLGRPSTVADETRPHDYNNNVPAHHFLGKSASVFNTSSTSSPSSSSSTLTMTTGGNTTAVAANMAYPLARVPSTTSRPRTIVVKRSRPVIKLQPVPSTKRRRWQQGRSTYIDDDGSDHPSKSNPVDDNNKHDNNNDDDDDDDNNNNNSDCEPVFPRMEDLVLYLRSDLTPQPLLESALNAMREEYMRNSMSSSGRSSPSTKDSGSTRSRDSLANTDDGTAALTSPDESCGEQEVTTEVDPAVDDDQGTPKTAVQMTVPVALPSMDDYDPFAYINPVYGAPSSDKPSPQPSVTILHPPTPAQTPPPNEPTEAESTEVVVPEEQEEQPQQPSQQQELPVQPQQQQPDTEKEVIEELDCSIVHVPIEPNQPPIELQNSIRAVLRQHYPLTSARGTLTPPFSPSPPHVPAAGDDGADDGNDLWRPLFGRKATSSLPAAVGAARGHLRHAHKQVLAVGVQPGVRREYAARVIGQVERFGTEPTGSSRCARLDFRYLLANTMQAFASTARTPHMAERRDTNPFSSPSLLAALMLPHLETYLAVHADVRFLILEYPPEHLPTVAAMQRLAGADLLKVAQIVADDADADGRLQRPVTSHAAPEGSIRSGASSRHYSQRTSSLSSSSNSRRRSIITAEVVGGSGDSFLLPASASARDIADFVTAVWDISVPERRPRSARPDVVPSGTATWPATPTADNYNSLPLESSHAQQRQPSELAVASPPTPQDSPVGRKPKPTQLRVSTLSAFPKPTGPQSPLTPVANMGSSVLAPRSTQEVTPPLSGKPKMDEFRPASSRRSPSPEDEYHYHAPQPQPQHVVARVSAVGTSTLPHLRRQLSNSTMRTTNSIVSAVSRASSTPHIAHLRKGTLTAAMAPPTPSRLYDPASSSSSPLLSSAYHPQNQQQYQQQYHHMSLLTPPTPRFLNASPSSPSVAGSTLHSRGGIMDDGASSIMTFDPAEDSDYDQEERRLMPFFGKKRRRAKPGTQKALRVLGMMA